MKEEEHFCFILVDVDALVLFHFGGGRRIGFLLQLEQITVHLVA